MSAQRALSVSLRPVLAQRSPLSPSLFLFQQQNQQRPWQPAVRLGSVLAHNRGLTPSLLRRPSPAAAVALRNIRLHASTPYPQQPIPQQFPPNPEPQPKKRNIFVRSIIFLAGAYVFWSLGDYVGRVLIKSYAGPLAAPGEMLFVKEYEDDKDAETCRELLDYVTNHPLYHHLNENGHLKATHPHYSLPNLFRQNNLTADTLVGPNLMAFPPMTWQDKEGQVLYMIVHVGKGLCGHPDIVHGGFVATLLDEFMARCCFKAVPHEIAMTARLNIDYKAPTPADEFLLLSAQTVQVEGRKAAVKGTLQVLPKPEDVDFSDKDNVTYSSTVLAHGEGLYVSPRQAQAMSQIHRFLMR